MDKHGPNFFLILQYIAAVYIALISNYAGFTILMFIYIF